MTVRHLRQIFACVTPCAVIQSNVRIDRRRRARQMLANMLPILAEKEDGALEPRGYPAEVAALLGLLESDDEIEVVVRSAAESPAACPLPLHLEICHKQSTPTLKAATASLFAYWVSSGEEDISKETVAFELSQSATTYMRKINWAYPHANPDSANESDWEEIDAIGNYLNDASETNSTIQE